MNQNEFEISTDKKRLDLAVIHDFLSTRSYWAKDISLEVLKKSVGNALCFGVYHRDKQVGFARVITDFATTAYIGDVFILEAYRGKGLGKLLVKTIVGHPELANLRLWVLGTKDAHGLYEKVGFKRTADTHAADRFMILFDPDVYTRRVTLPVNR
jgi:GNAT superfamily N-acetyltransferase